MLFQIPDLAWLNFPSPPEAGQDTAEKTRERAGGNSCQGSMSVLIPQECTSEIYITVMTTTDTQQDNPAGQAEQRCGCYCCCCCLFWFVSEKLQTYQHIVFVFKLYHVVKVVFVVVCLQWRFWGIITVCVWSHSQTIIMLTYRNIKTKWKWYQTYHLISLKTTNMKFSIR